MQGTVDEPQTAGLTATATAKRDTDAADLKSKTADTATAKTLGTATPYTYEDPS